MKKRLHPAPNSVDNFSIMAVRGLGFFHSGKQGFLLSSVSSPSKEQAGLYSFQPLAFSLRHLRTARYNIDAYLEGIRIFRIDGELPRFFFANEKAVG